MSRRKLARELGISRSALYYQPVMPTKDWLLKCEIEKVLREHPSYGYRRVALHLQINKKRTQSVKTPKLRTLSLHWLIDVFVQIRQEAFSGQNGFLYGCRYG